MNSLDVRVGSLTFDILSEGSPMGEAVLFLHGFPESATTWSELLPIMADAGYFAVAPNLRGYARGARPPDPDAYVVPELVGDVVAIIERVAGAPVHLVGHDWGGSIAWHTAARRPDLLRSLTVLSTPHPAALSAMLRDSDDQAQRSSYMTWFKQPELAESTLLGNDAAGLRALFEPHGPAPDRIEAHLARLREPGALTAALNWYRAASYDSIREMARIVTPTLYIWGTEDSYLGREAAEATAAWVDGRYVFQALTGIGHWIVDENPVVVAELLLRHFANSTSQPEGKECNS